MASISYFLVDLFSVRKYLSFQRNLEFNETLFLLVNMALDFRGAKGRKVLVVVVVVVVVVEVVGTKVVICSVSVAISGVVLNVTPRVVSSVNWLVDTSVMEILVNPAIFSYL